MGFTLVELMVVIAIIGVAAGAVVLSMPDPRPTLAVEAERFAARLTLAREEVVMTNRPVALRADAAGYGFESFDGAVWTPLTGVLAPKAWGRASPSPRPPAPCSTPPAAPTPPACGWSARARPSPSPSMARAR